MGRARCKSDLRQKQHLIITWLANQTTLPKTNSSPLKIGHPKSKLAFQASIFRCYASFWEGKLNPLFAIPTLKWRTAFRIPKKCKRDAMLGYLLLLLLLLLAFHVHTSLATYYILLMEEILHQLYNLVYKYIAFYGLLYVSTGAGFWLSFVNKKPAWQLPTRWQPDHPAFPKTPLAFSALQGMDASYGKPKHSFFRPWIITYTLED